MRVKIFTAMSQSGLEKKVNRFLEFLEQREGAEVADIQFRHGFGEISAMVVYKSNTPEIL